MEIRTLILGEKVFEFISFTDWCDTAPHKFKQAKIKHKVSSAELICIDRRGHVCTIGKHFMRSFSNGAYPVEVFLIDESK